MKNGEFFLWRNIRSIVKQSFTDYEIVIVDEGKIAENTNAGMKRARGDIIKILYLDDHFHSVDALRHIVDGFDDDTLWLATGCLHQKINEKPHSAHIPKWNDKMYTGENTLGSPSVMAFRNGDHLFFDERLQWPRS